MRERQRRIERLPFDRFGSWRASGAPCGFVEITAAVFRLRCFMQSFGRRLPILLYHHVGARRENTYPALTVSPHVFEKQIAWLKKNGYACISVRDWICWRKRKCSLPRRAVMITFDDAYADLCEFAFPVLQRYGFHATVFVVSGYIGQTSKWDSVNKFCPLPLMSEQQIRYWQGEGIIEVGCHSHYHHDMTDLTDSDYLLEIHRSRELLQQLTGRAIDSFAYPYGRYNERLCRAVSHAFELGFTTKPGLNCLGTPSFLQRRIQVFPGDPLLCFRILLTTGWGPSGLLATVSGTISNGARGATKALTISE